jgi:hypothetical protein
MHLVLLDPGLGRERAVADDREGGGGEHAVAGREPLLCSAPAPRGRSSPSPSSVVLAVEDAPSP